MGEVVGMVETVQREGRWSCEVVRGCWGRVEGEEYY